MWLCPGELGIHRGRATSTCKLPRDKTRHNLQGERGVESHRDSCVYKSDLLPWNRQHSVYKGLWFIMMGIV